MPRLTYKQRKKLRKKTYALPSKRTKANPAGRGAYPIPDIAHGRNALARVSQHGTPAEKKRVRAAVYKKYPSLKPKKRGRG